MTDNIQWVKTHCARMDHGGCSLLVGIENNRIVKIKGDPAGYLNKGYICPKGLVSADRLYHPSRLKHPLQRAGKRGEGKWKRISWPEALNVIIDSFERIKADIGPRGVAFCTGMPKGLEHFVLIRLANIFGSPNVVACQDVCHAPREISGIHTCGFYPVSDFHHRSSLVVLWGSNLTATNEEGEICSLLLEQIKQGTELIVIDPKRTDLAEKASHWLQIRPGTDNALALAFLNVIIEEKLYDSAFVDKWTFGFEDLASHVQSYPLEKMAAVTGIDVESIRVCARAYARSHPAAIQWGNAIEHNINTFDTARSLVCLMSICGNLDVPGGNIQANEPGVTGLGRFVRADLLPSKRKEIINASHNTIPRLMTVPPALFRKAVLDEEPYPVKGAYIQCANPLLGYADSRMTFETLKKLEFTAVADMFMTPSAAMADIVLPVATQYEFNDIGHYGLGHGCILARPQIVKPPDECWPDMKILNELGKALSPDKYWYDEYEQLLEELLAPTGLSYSRFVEKGYLKGEGRFKKYLDAGFRTPTGKVELRLSTAEKFNLSSLPLFDGMPEEENSDFPLILTSGKDPYYLHSSYRWVKRLREKRPNPLVLIHPETAALFGICENDEVLIETCYGAVIQIAELTDRVAVETVFASYGWWFPEGRDDLQYEWEKSNYNMLTSTKILGKEFGTPNLKGIRCRISLKREAVSNASS
jgi:anaerobic selenocysteine-containing dehydrogenase